MISDSGVTLHPVEPGDAGEILTLQRAAYVTEAQLHGGTRLPPPTQTLAELAVELREGPAIKAVVGDRIVGVARAIVDGPVARIGRVAVAPDHQERGIGTALARAMEDRLRDRVERFTFDQASEEDVARGDPSPWITRFAALVPAGGTVLDVAAGRGRHTRWLLDAGHAVVAVDRDVAGLRDLTRNPDLEVVAADLERGTWPLSGRRFAGIVVTNYLHRPLLPVLIDALVPGGVLLYETFAVGHERHGRPRNPDWLLRPGELLDLVRGRLRVVAYEDLEVPRPARIQRIAAVHGPTEHRDADVDAGATRGGRADRG